MRPDSSPSLLKPGRLVIVTQWFPPEPAPFGHMMRELATDLATLGWQVTVITGYPHHPTGIVFPGYRKRWFSEELQDEFRVWRVWLATSANRSLLHRALGFLSFTLSASWTLLTRARVDVIFAVMQPLSVAMVLPLVARLRGAKLVFNVQDLHPETQVRLGMIRNPWVIGLLRALERHGYRSCARLTVICEAFRRHCIASGASPERVELIENWIDTDELQPVPRDNAFRNQVGCDPNDFIVLWAGTLGHVAGADTILEAAARLLGTAQIRFVIVGDGPQRQSLLERAQLLGLGNVRFVPFQTRAQLPNVQGIADVSVLTLGRGYGNSSVPSKLLGYMAAGRAVVAAAPTDSATAQIIREARCGVVVEPEDAVALAEAIADMYRIPERAAHCGRSGRDYVVKHFSRHNAVARYSAVLEAARQQG